MGRVFKLYRIIIFAFSFVTPLLITKPCIAQIEPECDPTLFLEPNRFSITKELQDRTLWLELGFGRDIFRIHGASFFGIEALAWSRLEMISGFRFPLETIDYFFGVYAIWMVNRGDWRLRISHISSHLADGSDTTITGGASSRYSREFIELRREGALGAAGEWYWSLGLRAYFHQVTKIENWLDLPASIMWKFLPFDRDRSGLYAFLSSGAGPIWPCMSVGIRLNSNSGLEYPLDLELYYQYGASWAGTDEGAKRSTINLQMDVRGF